MAVWRCRFQMLAIRGVSRPIHGERATGRGILFSAKTKLTMDPELWALFAFIIAGIYAGFVFYFVKHTK